MALTIRLYGSHFRVGKNRSLGMRLETILESVICKSWKRTIKVEHTAAGRALSTTPLSQALPGSTPSSELHAKCLNLSLCMAIMLPNVGVQAKKCEYREKNRKEKRKRLRRTTVAMASESHAHLLGKSLHILCCHLPLFPAPHLSSGRCH